MRGGVNMASIKDVAQKAGVGVGTVSRVLNNSGYVSDETREKIEEAMKNLLFFHSCSLFSLQSSSLQ